MTDPVNSPPHYKAGDIYETIRVIEAWGLGYHLGNAVKYISRAGKKDPAKFNEDLEKAIWYVRRAMRPVEVDPPERLYDLMGRYRWVQSGTTGDVSQSSESTSGARETTEATRRR